MEDTIISYLKNWSWGRTLRRNSRRSRL